jgi:hypothetical protein
MAKRPKRSWLAGWFPDDAVREARTFLGHVVLTLVMLAGLWVLQYVFGRLFQEHEPQLFGWVPVRWFFDAADAGVLLRFAYRAIVDPWRKQRR